MRGIVWQAGLWIAVSAQMALGQVIQLPSFHSFSVDTTVVVPDSGRAAVADNKQGRTSAGRSGVLPANRALAVDRRSNGASALAAIHDPAQADAALRRRAQAQSRVRPENSAAAAAPWSARAAAQDRAVGSVTAIENQRALRAATVERETLALLDKARAAAAGGKPGVATIYYQRAAAQATGRLRHTIAAELGRMKLENPDRRPEVSRSSTADGSAGEKNSVARARR
jgi:hypothetical protein